MKTFNIIVLIAFLFGVNPISAQGKLEEAQNEINRNKHTQRGSNTSRNNNRSCHDCGTHNLFAQIILEHTFIMLYHLMIEFPEERNTDWYRLPLSEAPYYKGDIGNYREVVGEGKKHRIDFASSMLYHSPNLYGNQTHFKYHPGRLINLELDYLQLYEKLPNNRFELLRNLSFMINYDRLRLPYVNISWGLGATQVGLGVDKWGPTFGAQTEIFFVKPLSLNLQYKGSVINFTPLHDAAIELRYHKKRHFFNLGFNHFKFGNTSIPTAGLGYGIYL